METLQNDIRALRAQAGEGASLKTILDGLSAALSRHPEALAQKAGRYRLQASDTGLVFAFALENSAYIPLNGDDVVDVSISGKEPDLLRLIRGELSPARALLSGKLRIQGSLQTLTSLADLL